MKIIKIKPIDNLKSNKALLKRRPIVSHFELFKSKLKNLLGKIDEIEREENQKNHIRDFLLNTYYSESNEINTKDWIDLVIHCGKTKVDKVGVIIETKRPKNKDEMLSENKPNSKALHELVLYYLYERIHEKNADIKYLIATNVYEWYIFEASYFEKYFYTEKLIKDYNDWKAGRKVNKKTDTFYEEIAKPYIDSIDKDLPCTYFNLKGYQEILNKESDNENQNLIALYKILSPNYLLKLDSENDFNDLNEKFYKELLYIIGLEEKNDGTKNVIKRIEVDSQEGSFIENTIMCIDSKNLLDNIPDVSIFGIDRNEQLGNIAFELSLIWINRILFLKLLEGQLITYHKSKNPQDYKFFNPDVIPNFKELYNLFHLVLDRPINNRPELIKNKFNFIPYLNSSLFDFSNLEKSTITIDALNDFPIKLYSSTILKEIKKKKSSLPILEYLFKFLDSYNFSSEKGEIYDEDNKRIINASVLGKIFEKINGYKEGAVFTPSFITKYMARQTLELAVIQKYNSHFLLNNIPEAKDFKDLCNKIDKIDLKTANDIIESITICDPAVGSGHFLVSVLNELIVIKSELGILIDKYGQRLTNYNIIIKNDDLDISDDSGKVEYKYQITQSQRLQETIFNEKKKIIEQCLFGVDINPNSVQICRLRLWIELLKNAYYKKETDYTELETLPNIDFNIKCGNSLIYRFSLNQNLKEVFKKDKFKVEAYKNVVKRYKEEKDKSLKSEIIKFVKEIKEQFKTSVYSQDPLRKKISELKGQITLLDNNINIFGGKIKDEKDIRIEKRRINESIKQKEIEIEDKLNNIIFKNAFEWRFEFPEVLDENGEFEGFDIIIGNPPYIYNRDIPENERIYYQSKYGTADDLYGYFLIDSLNILKKDGFLTLITPNTYFTLSSKERLRTTLLKYNNLTFTYSGFVFKDVYVETQIFSLQKKKSSNKSLIKFIPEPNDYQNYQILESSYDRYDKNYLKRFFFPTKLNLSLYEKLNVSNPIVLKHFIDKLQGKKNKQIVELNLYRKSLMPNQITLLGLISEGEQGLVTGNNSKYLSTVIETDEQEDIIINDFLAIYNKYCNKEKKVSIQEFKKNKDYYYEEAEKMKINRRNPILFGKFFIYRTILKTLVKSYNELNEKEKKDGCENNTWVYYNRGNSEGFKWFIPYVESILWSKKSVKELKEGVITNSRWQGEEFFYSSGFAWVDYFSDKIKSFYLEEGIYSKNIVKIHSVINLSDKYIVALLNSSLISYFIKNFITNTHTLQINDGRQIPVMIPSKQVHDKIVKLVDKILISITNSNDIKEYESELDDIVYRLYNITKEEQLIIQNSFK